MSRLSDRRSWVSTSLVLLLVSACAPAKTDVSIPVPAATAVADAPSALTTSPPAKPQQPPAVQPAIPESASTSIKQLAPQPPSPLTQRPAVSKPSKSERVKSVRSITRPGVLSSNSNPSSSNPPVPTFKATQRMAGFSPDGSHFMYLESSRDTGAGIPKSTMQVVDLGSNTCVERGCVKTNFGEQDADRTISEAESKLLQQTTSLRQDLNMTSLQTGTVLPIQSKTRIPDGSEFVVTQLHNRPLQIQLRQKTIKSALRGGTANTDRSAMQLEVTYNGQKYTLDSLSNFRDWVFDYSIREVRLSPDGQTIAILLTATRPTFEGTLATTLVQGLTF